jgi:hypothetical protein
MTLNEYNYENLDLDPENHRDELTSSRAAWGPTKNPAPHNGHNDDTTTHNDGTTIKDLANKKRSCNNKRRLLFIAAKLWVSSIPNKKFGNHLFWCRFFAADSSSPVNL